MKTTYSTLFGLLYGIVWSAPALPAATARLLHETADYDHNQFHYDHINQGGGDYDDDANQQPGTMDDDSSPSPSPSSAPSYSPSPSYNPSSSSLSPSPSLASNNSTAMDDDINPDHVARVAAWQEFGYVEAEYLLKNGVNYYDCDTLVSDFWSDVQTQVFPLCDAESSINMMADYAQDCKLGAEMYTLEKIGECFDVEECSALGAAAAFSVAGSFCKSNSLYHDEERLFLPSKCVTHAETRCKSSAVEEIQTLTDDGGCAMDDEYQGLNALEFADDIYSLCEQEVYNMEQIAKLPWY